MLSFLSTVASALAIFEAVSALPASSSTGPSDAQPTDAPSCGSQPPPSQPACVPGRAVAPELIIVTDTSPDEVVSNPSGIDLSLSLGVTGSNQDQIALFKGIPSDAKDCKFGWKQRKANTAATFNTNGNALVEYRPLPADGVPFSFTSVEKFADETESSAMIDLTSWDQPGFASDQFHVGGGIRCAEEIRMHLRVSKLNGETGGVMLQGVSMAVDDSELQGVFVEWTC